MIIKEDRCYSKLLWLMSNKPFMESINKVTFKRPEFDFEGMAGYIRVEVEFEVRDLFAFANILERWWSLPDGVKMEMYKTAKGMRCE